MRKLLVIALLGLAASFYAQGQFIYKSAKSTAKMDTLQVKGSRIDITNSVKNPMAWLRVSGDSLFLGDGEGERSRADMAEGNYYAGYELTKFDYQITGTGVEQVITVITGAADYYFYIKDIIVYFDAITGTPGAESLSVNVNNFTFVDILLGEYGGFAFLVKPKLTALEITAPAVTVGVTAYTVTVIVIGVIIQ